MTKVADIEGVGRLEFPDDTPDDVMQKAVMEALGQAHAEPPAAEPPAETASAPLAAPVRQPTPQAPAPQRSTLGDSIPLASDDPRRLQSTLGDEIPMASDDPRRPPPVGPTPVDYSDKDIWWKLQNDLGIAKEGTKDLASAAARPVFQAAETSLLPLDVAHSVERFINAGEYNPAAFRKNFIYGPVDPTLPSQQAQAWLDAHTDAPDTLGGRLAELGSTIIAGGKIPGPFPNVPRSVGPSGAQQAAQRVIAEGEKHNVPVYFDDVTKSAFAKKLGVGAENVPIVGTSAGRAAQAEAAANASKAIAAKYGADDLAEEVPVLMQKSMQEKLGLLRDTAGTKFKAASDLLDQAGVVSQPRFVMAIRRELQHQKELGTAANQAVVNILQKYQLVPEGNFTLSRNVRSQLKSDIADFYRGGENKAIGEAGVERLREVRNALEADMGEFAKKTGGQAYDAWKDADAFYRTNLVPFKEKGFAELVKTAEPEKAWQYLMAQGGLDSRAARMYEGLTESGRATVRAGVIKEALENAVVGGPRRIFSPAMFAKYMEDNATVVDHFFKGADKKEIDGFSNLMRHVQRAGQSMENPPTGQRVIGALMLGSAAVSLKPLMIGIASAGGTRMLFQTQRGRDLLLAASRLKPGSPAMNVVGNRMGRLMLSSSMAGYHQAPGEEETEDAVNE
jgi:hypothetical protein